MVSNKINSSTNTSVILCTYNGSLYIEKQIKSILNQTINVDEIIIIDDFSEDETIQLISKFKENNNNIKIIKNKKNIGITRSFEKGISLSKGKYIFLSDQDDIWKENKVEVFIETFNNSNKLLLFSNAELIEEEDNTLDSTFFDNIKVKTKEKLNIIENKSDLVFVKRNIMSGAMCAFHRKIINDILPFVHDVDHLLHDRFIASIIASKNPEAIGIIDQILVSYRIHKNQYIGFNTNKGTKEKTKTEYFLEEISILEQILKRYENKVFRRAHYFWHIRSTLKGKSFLKKFISINTLYLEGDYKRLTNSPIREALSDLKL